MDADSLIHIARPGDSHNRLYPISMGRYGPQVAVPRILETYRRLGIKQSFFIPGWCIETYPDAIEAILAGGHEIGHHGYLHEDPIDAPDQRRWFEKALAAHHKYCGKFRLAADTKRRVVNTNICGFSTSLWDTPKDLGLIFHDLWHLTQ